MSVAWPSYLPPPLVEGAKLTAGSNVRRRQCQSGRVEQRRFGTGAPDSWQLTWRLTADEHDDFRAFYSDDLDLGVEWITADWLTQLGYGAGYEARLLGYPQERIMRYNSGTEGHADVSCEVLVKEAAA